MRLVVPNLGGAGVMRTVRAAVGLSVRLDAVADDAALAVRARRSEYMDRALEAVEGMLLSALGDQEGLVVVVAADLTLSHCALPLKTTGRAANHSP